MRGVIAAIHNAISDYHSHTRMTTEHSEGLVFLTVHCAHTHDILLPYAAQFSFALFCSHEMLK